MYEPTVQSVASSPGITSCSRGSQSAALRQASSSSSGRLAHEHGPAEAPLERDRIARLDDGRVGQRGRGRARLVLAVGRERERHADAGALGDRVLMALLLQRLEHVPAAARQLVGGQARRVARHRGERRVVRRQHHGRLGELALGEVGQEGDVGLLVLGSGESTWCARRERKPSADGR